MEASKTKGEGGEEVKEAKATPDLVAAAGEKRNSMTMVGAGELILSPSRRWQRRRQWVFAGSER